MLANKEINQYNAAARDLMKSNNIPINDLHALIWNNYAEYLRDDQLHLSEAGENACAEAVVESISAFL